MIPEKSTPSEEPTQSKERIVGYKPDLTALRFKPDGTFIIEVEFVPVQKVLYAHTILLASPDHDIWKLRLERHVHFDE